MPDESGAGGGAPQYEGVTRQMIRSRREEVLEKIKRVERRLEKEQRRTRRGMVVVGFCNTPMSRFPSKLFSCCLLSRLLACLLAWCHAARSKSKKLQSRLRGAGSNVVSPQSGRRRGPEVSTARSTASFRAPAPSPMTLPLQSSRSVLPQGETKTVAAFYRQARQGHAMARLLDTMAGLDGDPKQHFETTTGHLHTYKPNSGACVLLALAQLGLACPGDGVLTRSCVVYPQCVANWKLIGT